MRTNACRARRGRAGTDTKPGLKGPAGLAALVALAGVAGPALAQTSNEFRKEVYILGTKDAPLKEGSKIFGGGIAQIWRGPFKEGTLGLAEATHKIVSGITEKYMRAANQLEFKTFSGKAPGEFLVEDSGKTLKDGWNPDKIEVFKGGKLNQTRADLDAEVSKIIGTEKDIFVRVKGKKDPEKKTIKDYATASFNGSVQAGVNKDKADSADAYAAAQVKGAQYFTKVEGKDADKIEVIQKNIAVGGAWVGPADKNKVAKKGAVADPYFLSIADETAGTGVTDWIMAQRIDWEDAAFRMDDAGIQFSVSTYDTGSPHSSFVELAFVQNPTWIEDPYSYGVRLEFDPDLPGRHALALSGEAALWDWVFSENPVEGTVTYSTSWGPDGMPADFAVVDPNRGYSFTDGNSYSIDLGGMGGLFASSAVVPSPGTLALLGLGLLAVARRRK